MKTFEEDIKLREVIKDLNLESPGKDFTLNVLERIHREVPFAFQIKKDPVLGKGFWIIMALFVVIGVLFVVGTTVEPGSDGLIGNFLKSIDTSATDSAYKGIIGKMNQVPAGIIGILLASSILIFLERFLSLKKLKI